MSLHRGNFDPDQMQHPDDTTKFLRGDATWAVPPGGGSVLTNLGDLLTYGGSPAALQRLPVGSDGQVLTARSSATDGIDWETPSAGGGGGFPVSVVDPTLTTFQWGDGPGSGTHAATLTATSPFINLFYPRAGNGDGLKSRTLTAAPSTPYTLEIGFMPSILSEGSGAALRTGFCWRDSSGKYIMVYCRSDGNIEVDWFTNATTGNSARYGHQAAWFVNNAGTYFKLVHDGTNLTASIGNGLMRSTATNWTQIWQEAANAFLAANPLPGFFASVESNDNVDAIITVFHWKLNP